MAGLSVLLETQKDFPKHRTQIICKTSLYRSSSLSCASSSASPTASSSLPACPFLEHCYFCRKRLLEGNDIYMYRGDRAFCSEECRCRQIFIDEESGGWDNCSLAAAAAAAEAAAAGERSPEARGSRRRTAGGGKGRAVAGGFAY